MIDATELTIRPTKRLARSNAADQVLNDLRDSILRGDLVRGSRLPTEKQLAEMYGVSGPTIREAIRGLTTTRLIEVRHGSGAYVTADSEELLGVSLNAMMRMESVGVAELLGVLSSLHAYAAERSALLAGAKDIARMEEALAAIETATRVEDIPDALIRFLGAIVNSSGNPLLATLCRFLTRIQVQITTELSGSSLEGWRSTARPMTAQRKRLLEAIRARDPGAAREAAEAYHQKSIEVIGALPRAGLERAADPALSKMLASLLQRNQDC